MLKVLAAVLAVLSAIISISIYTATLPAVQKQAADNAAAIEQNAADIKDVDENVTSVDNSVEGLNTRLETLEEKHIYLHEIYFAYNFSSGTYNNQTRTYTTIINDSNTQFNFNSLKTYIKNTEKKQPCYGAYKVSGQVGYTSYLFVTSSDNFYIAAYIESQNYTEILISFDNVIGFKDTVTQIL